MFKEKKNKKKNNKPNQENYPPSTPWYPYNHKRMFQSIRNSAIARASALHTIQRAASAVPARFIAAIPARTGSMAKLGPRQLCVSAHIRQYSVLTQKPAKEYKYRDVKALIEGAAAGTTPEVLLIDVREPTEFQEGHIPGAKNVPFKSSPGAFDLAEDEFEESFGFPKPAKDQPLVFYCLGGVRLTAAEELANTFGYTNRGNYIGSYEDWVAQETAAKKA